MKDELPKIASVQKSKNMFKDFELYVHEGISMKALLRDIDPELAKYKSFKVEFLVGRIGPFDITLSYIKWRAKDDRKPNRPALNLSMKVFVPGKRPAGHLETGETGLRAFANGRGDIFLNYEPFAPEIIVQQAFDAMQQKIIRFVSRLFDAALASGTDGFIAEANARLHEKRAQQCREHTNVATAILVLDEEE